MEDHFKRPNKLTGMPYESGFEDEDGRFFVKYLNKQGNDGYYYCLLYTSPSPRDRTRSRMPSSA